MEQPTAKPKGFSPDFGGNSGNDRAGGKGGGGLLFPAWPVRGVERALPIHVCQSAGGEEEIGSERFVVSARRGVCTLHQSLYGGLHARGEMVRAWQTAVIRTFRTSALALTVHVDRGG